MILRSIHDMLWMLDPHTKGEWLGLEQNIILMQQPIYIPRRMSGGQYDGISKMLILIINHYPFDFSGCQNKIRDFLVEQHFATCIEDGFPDGRDDLRQLIGSDMWA